jgi:Na+/melibiose symporter-like transporter
MLMRNFSWSSVFWINVPLLVVALIGTLHLIPDSRNPDATKLDPVGAILSIGAVGALVYAIIQAPADGWTSRSTLTEFTVGAAVGALFVAWELCRDEPMLDMRLFANRSFSASTVALSMLFFAMAGMVFLQAQYLQFVLGYTPLAAGFALVPAALGMLLGTGVGTHLNVAFGSRVAIATGTLISAAGVAVQAQFIDGTSYVPTGVGLLLFGLGAGIAMPAATDLIMATLPPSRAGVGSAVNDTVRELGGALGVAVIGSVAATNYRASVESELTRHPGISDPVQDLLTDNVGSALQTSGQLGADGAEIASIARTAFVDSMSTSLWLAVGLAVTATVIAVVYLPRRDRRVHGASAHATPVHVESIADPVGNSA